VGTDKPDKNGPLSKKYTRYQPAIIPGDIKNE
jgi:hypothetical protein